MLRYSPFAETERHNAATVRWRTAAAMSQFNTEPCSFFFLPPPSPFTERTNSAAGGGGILPPRHRWHSESPCREPSLVHPGPPLSHGVPCLLLSASSDAKLPPPPAPRQTKRNKAEIRTGSCYCLSSKLHIIPLRTESPTMHACPILPHSCQHALWAFMDMLHQPLKWTDIKGHWLDLW